MPSYSTPKQSSSADTDERREGSLWSGLSGTAILAAASAAVTMGMISLTFVLPIAIPAWGYALYRVNPGYELLGILIGPAAVAGVLILVG